MSPLSSCVQAWLTWRACMRCIRSTTHVMDGRWPGDVCQQLSMRFAIDRETILGTSHAGRALIESVSEHEQRHDRLHV